MPASRRAHNTLPNSLGELELKVMELIWSAPGSDARRLTEQLSIDAPCRLTTVQATLERLVRKQCLEREKKGHAYQYFPKKSRSELLGSMLKDVIHLLHDGQANTILSSFVNVAARLEDDALDELEKLIQRKRQEEKNGGKRHG
jgi:predicted transcriptional regulator